MKNYLYYIIISFFNISCSIVIKESCYAGCKERYDSCIQNYEFGKSTNSICTYMRQTCENKCDLNHQNSEKERY